MINTKTVVIGALFAAIAALFQLIPTFFSEIFVFFTIFSAVPIYIVSRINPKAGVLSYFVASMIVMLFSTHEGLFFLFTNGIIGISLGICSYYMKTKAIIWFLSSLALTSTLSIMNYGIGIPVFGSKIPGIIIIQISIIFLFSTIYNIIYYYFSSFIFNILKRFKIC
ncbi:hypothetical protein [Clostridium pasteurianum]|uniref:DUF2232 domain-containing protein n=1 Tax=Clostridium pasteurianum BC1 TaxID=86416 RepID=R4KBI3_CLOPA|nr:hypothetical protein [Clostridium pasteurianum]AGK96990.1 hypothetical protein Clopa_2109 [Clostridium pasteurianum BC1]